MKLITGDERIPCSICGKKEWTIYYSIKYKWLIFPVMVYKCLECSRKGDN